MDPHANVVESLCLARDILKRIEGAAEEAPDGPGELLNTLAHRGAPVDDAERTLTDTVRLAELVISLDEWRASGSGDPYADPQAPQVNPQANALLERCRRNCISTVVMDPDGGSPGQGLPDGYLYVVEQGCERGFEVGIAPDGRVSS